MVVLVPERRSVLPARAWERLCDRRMRTAIAVAGAGAAVAGGLLLGTSGVLGDARAYGPQEGVMIGAGVRPADGVHDRRDGRRRARVAAPAAGQRGRRAAARPRARDGRDPAPRR